MSNPIKVKDMTPSLRNACVERGFAIGDEMTPREAVKEWSGWHLGDESWADDIIDMYENPANTHTGD